jgi:dienelactone hydrolase
MSPFYFGPANRQMFAIYHAPREAGPARAALLMCSPFGHEAIRVHRLYRVLAERMARQGIAVLRFDYYGTGESGGEDGDGEMKGWRLDLVRAHDELVRRSGATTVGWLAARLGAAIALQSARYAQGLQRIALWDPILDGPAYIEEMRAAQLTTLELGFYSPNPAWYQTAPAAEGASPIPEVLGHTISREFGAQLAALRPDSLQLPAGVRASVFASPGDTVAPEWSAREAARGGTVVCEEMAHPIVWTSDPMPNQAIVPAHVMGRLSAVIQ